MLLVNIEDRKNLLETHGILVATTQLDSSFQVSVHGGQLHQAVFEFPQVFLAHSLQRIASVAGTLKQRAYLAYT